VPAHIVNHFAALVKLQRVADVVQHRSLGNSVQNDARAAREEREPCVNVAEQLSTGTTGQCAEPEVESKLLALLADEVQNRQQRFPPGSPESSAELLKKYRGTLCRAEQQEGVNVG